MTLYECSNCPMTFTNFPAANNHELDNDLRHLVYRQMEAETVELAICSCGCGQVLDVAQAVWNDDMPYENSAHMADHLQEVAA